MIFLDSNVPMYVFGNDPEMRRRAETAMRRLGSSGEAFVTDAEVFQEVLHRYRSIGRRDLIQPVFDFLSLATFVVYPIELRTVQSAKDVANSYPALSARDALHVAVMLEQGVSTILSHDGDFDAVPRLTRISI
jgi:predicted nucleic acid-binding protein